jgi:hypothetical protein
MRKNYWENAAPQMDPETATHTSRDPAKRTWTRRKVHLMREFKRKMPRPKWIPRPRHTLCASLRS